MYTLEQSLNRLEKAVQNISALEMHHKALERPVFDTKNAEMKDKIDGVQNFVKYGEKASSSQEGTGSLVIRKPSVSAIVEKPFAPTPKINN